MIVRDVHIQTKIRVFSVKIAIFENQIAKNEIPKACITRICGMMWGPRLY